MFNPFVVPNHIVTSSTAMGFVCFGLNLEEDIERGSRGSNEYVLISLVFLVELYKN